MDRCFASSTVAVVAFILSAVFIGDVSHAAPQRNILLIVADDLGRNDLGCYGSEWVRTPNLDALARDGVRFANAFATVASCSPSRAVLLSGLYTHTNGQYGLAHAEHHQATFGHVRALPKLLNDAGYRTGVVGKLHVGPPAVYPFTTDMTRVDARSPVAMAERVGTFLAGGPGGADKAKPFFLLVGFTDPHRHGSDFVAFNEKYRAEPGAGPPYDPANVEVPSHLPDRPEVRAELAGYAECVSRLDRGVGLLMKALRDAGHADDTLVIFLSDNGIPFPGAKTTLYDPGVHLPLIVAPPGVARRGIVNNAMVSWVDVAPTILDWAGIKDRPALPGRSLLPILGQENPAGWDVVYGSHVFHEITMYYPVRTIRTRRHKLILNLAHQLPFPFASDLHGSATWQGVLTRKDEMFGRRAVNAFINRPREELYDLQADPHEVANVIDDPAFKEARDHLRARLRKWQEDTKDPWILKYNYE